MNSVTKRSHAPAFESISIEDMDEHAGQAAAFLKLLANPNRLMILCHLLDSELSVSALNAHLPLSQSALSQHLAVLRHAGVVNTRREHQVIFYRLASPEVTEVMSVLYRQFCQPDAEHSTPNTPGSP